MDTAQQRAERPSPARLRQDGNVDVLPILERQRLFGLKDAILKHSRDYAQPRGGSGSHDRSPFGETIRQGKFPCQCGILLLLRVCDMKVGD
jgi:hypothetical protein